MKQIKKARRVVTGLWLALCAFQLSIWLITCVVSMHIVNPWWLWTVAVGGIIVSWLWWATEPRASRP